MKYLKEIAFEMLVTLAYFWFVFFWALLVAWYIGVVWAALVTAVLFVPYYYLMKRIVR